MNTLLERLLHAVDEVLIYRTESKLQDLKKLRDEIRQKNEFIAQAVDDFRSSENGDQIELFLNSIGVVGQLTKSRT